MNPLKIYRWATWGLLGLNVTVLAFFLLFPSPGPGSRPPRAIHEMLNFDEAQQAIFLRLVEEHQGKMRAQNVRQNELLQQYFAPLTAGYPTDSLPPVPAEIATIEQEKIAATYQHFLEVERLLRPEQKGALPAFVEGALRNIFQRNRQEPRRKRPGKPER